MHRRGIRPDHHLGHGRAAPRNHRRPHEARVQRRANVGKPQVAYRETIRARSSGGASSSNSPAVAASTVTSGAEDRTAPNGPARASSSSMHRRRRGSARIHPGGRKGIRKPLADGVLAGYPGRRRQGRRCSTASYHDVDSNEMAFKIAGSMGFKEGMRKPGRCCSTDDGGRGRDPEDYGRRDGRPEPAVAWSRAWTTSPSARSSRPRCRWPRCSATRPRCVRRRRAGDLHDGIQAKYNEAPKNIAEAMINSASRQSTPFGIEHEAEAAGHGRENSSAPSRT